MYALEDDRASSRWPRAWSLLGAGHPGIHTVQDLARLLTSLSLLLGRSLRSLVAELILQLKRGLGILRSLSISGRVVLRGREVKRWHGVLAALVAYKAARILARTAVYLVKTPQRNALNRKLRTVRTYDEWQVVAKELDACTGNTASPELSPGESAELAAAARNLRDLRLAQDLSKLKFTLRMDLRRSGSYEVLQRTLDTGVQFIALPEELKEYLSEAIQALQYLATTPDLTHEHKVSFFRELRHAYGRTALVLSGGGSFGFFHFGVIRVLLKAGILPRIVSGSSAGALSASILASRPESQLAALVDVFPFGMNMNLMSNTTTPRILRHLLSKGTAQDTSVFIERLQRLFGPDMTFADAYAVSGHILNVAVSAADTREPPRLLNYLTAPQVLVWSAVACSSAFPLLFKPQDLLARAPGGGVVPLGLGAGSSSGPSLMRRWRDGSLEADLPMRGVGETFNVNHYLVSQANPWLLPVLAAQRALPPRMGRLLEAEFKHRCAQALTFFPRSSVLKLLGQAWSGHVTLTLPWSAFPVTRAAQNFGPADIAVAMQEGQLQAWRALPAMQASCAVEAAIDAALRALLQPVGERGGASRRGRVPPARPSLPSWLHMPALGLPSVGEEGSLRSRKGSMASVGSGQAGTPRALGNQQGLESEVLEQAGGAMAHGVAEEQEEEENAVDDGQGEELDEASWRRVTQHDVKAARHVWSELAMLSLGSQAALDCIAP